MRRKNDRRTTNNKEQELREAIKTAAIVADTAAEEIKAAARQAGLEAEIEEMFREDAKD